MPRPRGFDVEKVIRAGLELLWTKGYAATTTEELRGAMRIARQSFYDLFQEKRGVLFEALKIYQAERLVALQALLQDEGSPIAALERLLLAIAEESDEARARGCLDIAAMAEMGADIDMRWLNAPVQNELLAELTTAVARAQELGEITDATDPMDIAAQVHATFVGMRVLAKGGAPTDLLRAVATSTIASLRQK